MSLKNEEKEKTTAKAFISSASWLTKEQIEYADKFPYATIVHYLTNFLTTREEQEIESKMLANPLLREKIEDVRALLLETKISTVNEFIRLIEFQPRGI